MFIWSAMLLHYNNNVKYCFIKTVNSETAFVSLVLDFFVWWSILFMINDNTFSFGTMSWVCMYGSNLKFSQHTHCAGVDYLRPGIRTCPRSFSSERAASPWRLWGCTWGVRALVLQYYEEKSCHVVDHFYNISIKSLFYNNIKSKSRLFDIRPGWL